MENEKLEWRAEKRKVKDLKNLERNPRKITKEAFERLKNRIIKNGFHDVVKLDTDDIILSGNQRKRALIDLSIEDVNVLIPNRPLTELERKEIIVESNRQDGIFDFEMLSADYDISELIDMGFTELELGLKGDDEEHYTTKVEAPIYEPKGEKPQIKDLHNLEKYKELIQQIDESNLNEDEKEFLRLSATRHIVFNYSQIAEYYAHAGKETQDLMEKSALIIIDYNKAIEGGYMHLVEDISKIQTQDYEEQ